MRTPLPCARRLHSTVARIAVAAFAMTVLAACGGESGTSATEATTTSSRPPITTSSAAPATTTPEPVVITPEASTTGAPPPAAPAPAAALMPNVVCMNLQAAQNKIQDAGVFYSRSKDATGAGRRQVVDSNWVVVAQNPSPGTPFGEGDAVLSAVKIGEPNPC
ncbi:hypothetical protein ABH922_004144 [Rhodococcus sp. 27YEA15]|uniref:PASTA domain-containing protein n=1 Tax=Rhodococcus sp. 27YEA15 TaxID=3156259 RepID=UPI003C7D615C